MMDQEPAPSYRQPLVYHDLSHKETIEDTIYALEHLTHIVDEMFARIDTRIDEEKVRISAIKARANLCNEKINKIRGSTEAITVFSTAKFPAPKNLPCYPTLFGPVIEKHSPIRGISENMRYVMASPEESVLGNKELNTDLQDIITRVNAVGQDLERVEMIMEDEGLGPIPLSINSVGSMMLFNSSINLYQNYRTLDNLISTGREKVVQEEKKKGLASAPTTLIDGDALPDIQTLDLLFKPQMGEMSSLALPENLPLDFIANIQFDQASLPSIAPSMNTKPNPALPQLLGGSSTSKTPKTAEKTAGPPPPPSASTPPPPPPPSSSSAPPPPPPPPVAAPAAVAAPVAAPAAVAAPVAAPAAAGPPPPPPKPAAPPAQVVESGQSEIAANESAPATAAPSGRMNLLDAIKGMSVDRLRSKEESAMAAKKVQKKVDEMKPLTMQDALKERLLRRNNAISGKTDKEAQRRDSLAIQQARENISAGKAPVPPPPKKPAPPSTLRNLGFISVEDVEKSDDDSIPKFKPTATRHMSDSDTDSAVSELSFESRQESIRPPTTLRAPTGITPPPKPVVAQPAQTISPPPPASGGGLLNANNPALSSMLKRAASTGNQSDSESDDSDAEDEWDD